MSLYQDPSEEKKSKFREIFAMSLILFIAMYFFIGHSGNQTNNTQTAVANNQTTSPQASTSQNLPAQNTQALSPQRTLDLSHMKEKIITKDTDRYQLAFSSYYGNLKSIQLKDYKDIKGNNFNISPLLNKGDMVPMLYQLEGIPLNKGYKTTVLKNKIIFTQISNNIKVEKIYSFNKDKFNFDFQVHLTNLGNQAVMTSGHLFWGKGLGPEIDAEKRIQYDKNVTLGYFDIQEQKEKTISKNSLQKNTSLEWVGIDNRYFLMAIMPFNKDHQFVSLSYNDQSNIYDQSIELAQGIHLAPKASVTKKYQIYLGPKKDEFLKDYHRHLETVTERGWFIFPLLGKFLISILEDIEKVTHNYGLAIIIFALLLRLIFHPLNKQSMISMARQGELQGKIQTIKEKFPDKQVQNAKIMELYKKEGANPLKGCFPLFIQIPFFISFYRDLPGLIDLTQSHFLWIKDLSSPDTVYFMEAFKHTFFIPYRLNILPIVIAGATILQMKISSKGQASNPQMKGMTYIMPIMFIFILWNAPSGLNLYWLAQTVATILAQLHFTKNKEKILAKAKEKKKARRSLTTRK